MVDITFLFLFYCLLILLLLKFELPISGPLPTNPIKVSTMSSISHTILTSTSTTTTSTTTTTTSASTTSAVTSSITTKPQTTVPITSQPTTVPPIPPTTTLSPGLTTVTTRPPVTLQPTRPVVTMPLTSETTVMKTLKIAARDEDVIVVTQGDTKVATVTPKVVMAAELLPVTAVNQEPVIALMIPDTSPQMVVTESLRREAEGDLPVTAPAVLPLPSPLPTEHSELELTQTPSLVAPTENTRTQGPGVFSEVLPWPEEVDAEEEDKLENEGATFSAAVVLSGDGEVDRVATSYPNLLDIDSGMDFQYDAADDLLMVSSATRLSASLSSPPLLLFLSKLQFEPFTLCLDFLPAAVELKMKTSSGLTLVTAARLMLLFKCFPHINDY